MCFKPVFEFYIHFKANFSHYYVNQIFSEDPRKLNMKNCKPTQYQPKSQILFHKNIRLRDLYIITLILSMLYIWTIARFYQFCILIFTSLHRTIAFQKRYIHNINSKNVPIPSCIHKSIPNHKDFPTILWKLSFCEMLCHSLTVVNMCSIRWYHIKIWAGLGPSFMAGQ